ncbi:DUF2267 domain-containing protein [Nocardia sp. NBC_00881]|uniref:DUF2267 domain-containing protein n=1 Tax=Nocardia sp. NBC_00881 TaxID=2975995 RepID=UPI003863F378|nr:DUF2267 domain-containing protein [Nocardia sp. NBC_00881]
MVHTARVWLRTIGDQLGTDDQAFVYRAVRAWLHTVRDQVEVATAAHLAAQLPELLRGAFYEGWVPARVPAQHNLPSFVSRFADETGVSLDEAVALIGAVTKALSRLFSPGQLDGVFAVLPARLCELLSGVELDGTLGGAAADR